MKKIVRFSIIVTAAIVCVSLFAAWAINNYNNERQLNEDLAKRFDESMEASFPFLLNVSNALYLRANMLENNAMTAYNMSYYDYKETFQQLNIQYENTENGRYISYWLMGFYRFIPCVVCFYLESGGELREKETRAFRKIQYAYQNPHDPLNMEYDSLIIECNNVKVAISESMRDLAKYNKTGTPIDAWTKIDPNNYQYIHKRYKKQKDWPFNFKRK